MPKTTEQIDIDDLALAVRAVYLYSKALRELMIAVEYGDHPLKLALSQELNKLQKSLDEMMDFTKERPNAT